MPFAIAASRRISLFGSKISGFGLSPSRVGADGCPPAPPLEPYLKVSPHTARALIRPTIHYSLTRRPFPNSLTIVCRQPQPVLLQSSASGRISQLALAIICCPIYERFHLLSRHFRPDRRGHIQRITTDISFFGHPNAAPPDPPYGKVCPNSLDEVHSVSTFHN